jgi:hypothetical protein
MHAAPCPAFSGEMGILGTFCLDMLGTTILLISASQEARITDVTTSTWHLQTFSFSFISLLSF